VAKEVGIFGLGLHRFDVPLGENKKAQLLGGLRCFSCRRDVPGIVRERLFADIQRMGMVSLRSGRPSPHPDRLVAGARKHPDLGGIVVERPPLHPAQGLPITQIIRSKFASLLVHVNGIVEVRLECGIVAILEECFGFLAVRQVRIRWHREHSYQREPKP